MGAMHAQLFPCYSPRQINNCSKLISQLLSRSWIVAFISCMWESLISFHNPIHLGVVEAIPLIRNSLGSLNCEVDSVFHKGVLLISPP